MTLNIACITDKAAALLFQAEGYTDGDLTLYHSFSVTAFLKAENPVDFLSKASEVRSLHRFNFSKTNAGSLHIFCHLEENPVGYKFHQRKVKVTINLNRII